MRLKPAALKIKRPGVVEVDVKNHGRLAHALQLDGPTGVSKTRPLKPGHSAVLRADLRVPGEYEWYCPIADHADKRMRGTISVARKRARR
jgi:plastocyanin